MEPFRPLRERPPEEGARLLALRHLDQAAAAFPRLQDPADSEALHDFRVALRRLRSCLRSYGPWLDGSLPKKLRRRLKDLAAATGPGRDTEVQIEWLRGRSRHLGSSHRAGLAWLLARLEERMREAVEEMADHIPHEFPRFEEALRAKLSTYTTEIHLDAGAARPTLSEATAAILRTQASEVRSNLSHVEGPGDVEPAHEARISAKRLRYLLEPFAEELPEAASVVKHMKGLQETLGELHDAHVLEKELAELLEKAALERARRLLEIQLAGADETRLRAERRRAQEPGILTLARLNRVRRDRLYDDLETDWLGGQGEAFFEEVEALALKMSPHGEEA